MPDSHTVRGIACLQPSATVILHAIGELERVVACMCTKGIRQITWVPASTGKNAVG